MYPDWCERRMLEMENRVVNLRIRVCGSTEKGTSINVGVYIVTFSLSWTHKPIIFAFFVVRAKICVPSKTRKTRHSVVGWVQRSNEPNKDETGDSTELGKPGLCNRLHAWVCSNYLRGPGLKPLKSEHQPTVAGNKPHHHIMVTRTTRDISKLPGMGTFRLHIEYSPPEPQRVYIGACGSCSEVFGFDQCTPWHAIERVLEEHQLSCDRKRYGD